nr:reverse transcriptase domain-containing protein [Tanacetum cinerariifolium]
KSTQIYEKAVTPNYETCGGPHSYNNCPATVGLTHNVYATGAYQGGNSYQPQGNRNLLSYRSENYLGPPGFNQNQNRNNQNQNFQNQNRNQGNHHPQENNEGRNQFFQGASHGPNPPLAYQASAYQAPGYQAPTRRALIDVFERELTLRVGKEAITFNLDQTSRYSANYNDMTKNRIDVIDMDCEEYSQEVLGFSDVIASGNPTPYYDPIVSTFSPTLTPFRDSDFLLEEVDAFLALEDDPTLPKVDHSYFDTEGDILLLEAFLNDDPSLAPLNQGNYLPQI